MAYESYSALMLIRQEQPTDHAEISAITAAAFAEAEHSDQSEPEIIARLRASGALKISLVAIEGGELAGHIAFSPITIESADLGWFGLGPMAVKPGRQSQGIGSALVREGLAQLRSDGAAGCVVLGDPAYYSRFGFERDASLRYAGAPPEYFMRLLLDDRPSPTGRVDYASAFAS